MGRAEEMGQTDLVINVRIQRAEPLAGVAATEEGATHTFEGWMELIGVIAQLVDLSHRREDGRSGGEKHAGNR